MAFHIPEEFYYTKDHEWAQVDENIVTVGITEFAQDQLEPTRDLLYNKILQGREMP